MAFVTTNYLVTLISNRNYLMKVLLDIKDEKVSFFMELLKNFSYVKAKPLSNYKVEVFEGLQEAIEEINLIKEGKAKGTPARELLNEL